MKYSGKVVKSVKERRDIIVAAIMQEAAAASKPRPQKFDQNLYAEGEMWFNCGFTLEEASEEKRNNHSFVHGYERAVRLKNICDSCYRAGVEHFFSGIPLQYANPMDLNNEYFLKGYEDAKTMDEIKMKSKHK